MTVTDTLLESVAKALNAESYDVVSHLAVTSIANFTASPTATNIGTELGSRITTSNARAVNKVTYSAIRSGASVIDTVNGDTLTGLGEFDSVSGDGLHINVALPDVNQTTGFDIEIDVEATVSRR